MADTASPRTRLAALVLLVGATLLLGACSCLASPQVVGIYQHENGIVAQVDLDPDYSSTSDPLSLYLSLDGGRTWDEADPADLGIEDSPSAPTPAVDEPADAEAGFVDGGGENQGDDGFGAESTDQATEPEPTGPLFVPVAETEGCLEDGRCFRVVDGREVQEQTAGTWETSFTFTDEQLRRMESRDNDCSSIGVSGGLFTSLAIVELDGSTRHDETVIVSMGGQGLLRLDRTTDTWDRVAVGELSPVATWGPRWLGRLFASPMLGLLLSPVLLAINHRGSGWGRRLGAFGITVGLLSGLMITSFVLAAVGVDYAIGGPLALTGTAICLIVGLAIVLPKERPRTTPPPFPPYSGSEPPSPVRSGH